MARTLAEGTDITGRYPPLTPNGCANSSLAKVVARTLLVLTSSAP